MKSRFVYGTPGPGRPNSHILENIAGSWLKGPEPLSAIMVTKDCIIREIAP